MTRHACTGDVDTCDTCRTDRDNIEWERGPFANTRSEGRVSRYDDWAADAQAANEQASRGGYR